MIHITNKNVISFKKQLFKWKNTLFSPFVELVHSVNKQVLIRLIDNRLHIIAARVPPCVTITIHLSMTARKRILMCSCFKV